MAPSTSAMMSTSEIRGTLVRTWRPSASRQAAISLSTEFLAPPARTVPESGPLGLTMNRSTAPVWPLARLPPAVDPDRAQMTAVSSHRPNTPARASIISPTVA